MPSTPPTLICFDLGGVVIRICRSWEEGCAAAGLDCRADSGNTIRATPAIRTLINAHQVGEIDAPTYARRFSEHISGLYTADEVLAIHRAWTLDEYTGVGDVIDELHELGVSTAALSNTNDAHWQIMPTYAAFTRIQHPFASHELRLAKPDPAIYRAFEQGIGRSGSDILFFDDLSDNIAAARECGWRAEQIDHTGCTATQIRTYLQTHGVMDSVSVA